MKQMELKGLMPRQSIGWFDGKVKYIDQRLLPNELRVVETDDWHVLARAITTLAVRGAPLIGVTAAFAVAAAALKYSVNGLKPKLEHVIDSLATTRPTAVNLFWALEAMRNTLNNCKNPESIPSALISKALDIFKDDKSRCDKLGDFGASVIPQNGTVLTICNTGFLAAAGIGTALAAVYRAFDLGKKPHVYSCETRPLLQGARLTAWELKQADIAFDLLVDSVAANLIRGGKVDLCIIGADRIASNGDTVNKIGSFQLALACGNFGVPFFVSAPLSTVDYSCKSGADIPIEERSMEEVIKIGGKRITPKGVSALNPAFDMVPVDMITGIITEKGIFSPPIIFPR